MPRRSIDARMDDDQMANALAALALRVAGDMRESSEFAAKRGSRAPAALVLIFKKPGQSIDTLRRALGMSHSGTVRLVERLVQDGSVIKQQGLDARSVALSCTSLGGKRAKSIVKARRNVVDKVIGVLTPAERNHLEMILRKLPAAKIGPDLPGKDDSPWAPNLHP